MPVAFGFRENERDELVRDERLPRNERLNACSKSNPDYITCREISRNFLF